MDGAINLYGLTANLPAFLQQSSTWFAVILPVVLSCLLPRLSKSSASGVPEFHGVYFLVGTLLSCVFSIHRIVGDEESLLNLPGYALVVAVLPTRAQPHWARAYGFSFLSLLLADIWGASAPHLAHGDLPDDFYLGIGGAGLGDLLFLGPLLTAIPLLVKRWVIERGWGELTLGDALRRGYAVLRTRAWA